MLLESAGVAAFVKFHIVAGDIINFGFAQAHSRSVGHGEGKHKFGVAVVIRGETIAVMDNLRAVGQRKSGIGRDADTGVDNVGIKEIIHRLDKSGFFLAGGSRPIVD